MRRMKILSLVLSLLLLLSGCVMQNSENSGTDGSTANGTASETEDEGSGMKVDIGDEPSVKSGNPSVPGKSAEITLKGDSASCASDAVAISGGTVTIGDEGTYIVSGTLSDGMLIVDAGKDDDVTVLLNGAGITSRTSAAIYVRSAGNVYIETAAGSENYLVNGGSYTAVDESNIDAAVFSKDDLFLKGEGKLTVKAAAGHGIVSKDDLKLKSGTYVIIAAEHGITGRDSIKIEGGSFTVKSGKDAIHADNGDNSAKGTLTASGGDISIVSIGDGISASGTLEIQGGSFNIQSGGGSKKASDRSTVSAKGIKSAGNMTISNGTFDINAADDAVHSNADLTLSGGSFTVATGDDGFHADETARFQGGTVTITESYEGIEGLAVDISGGTIRINASDDGINAAGGADGSGFGGFGGDRFGPGGIFGRKDRNKDAGNSDGDSYIRISGGYIFVNADGDGLDSNGTLEISGGELYVSGPSDSMNGALDFDGTGTITGGTVIAVGASGMAQNFGNSSTQASVRLTFSKQSGGTVKITDRSGTVLADFKSETDKPYSSVVISCPGLKVGETYTVIAGDYSETITLSSLIYGGTGGFGGPGGFR